MKRRGGAGAGEKRPEAEAPLAPAKGGEKPKARGAELEKLKIPMPDVTNEVVILAAALVDHAARKKLVAAFPTPDPFFGQGHPEAWAVVVELEKRGLAYDPLTVRQLSAGKVDTAYLDTLIAQRPEAPPNLMHHVDVMRWDSARIEGIRGPVASFVEALRDPTADPERVKSLARQVSGAFEHTGGLRYLRDPAALAGSQIAEIRKRRAGQACYPYGIDGFDVYADGPNEGAYRMIPGAKPGQCTAITGVSGSGKTTFTARLGLAQERLGRKVLYGAWEQGSGNTLELLAGFNLGISRTRLVTGQISDLEEMQLEEEMQRLGERVRFFELPFDRHKSEKRTNQKALDTVQEYVEAWGRGGGVVILDLFRRTLAQTDPDEEEQALYRLQAMAQETEAHFLLVHQQRLKDLEQREDKQPTREGLKGSGAWVEMPDTIVGVHREFLFKAVPDNVLRLCVLKQRYGVWPLTVDCDWDAELGLIGGGRSVENARAGAASVVDEFLDAAPVMPKGKGGGRGNGRGNGRGRR